MRLLMKLPFRFLLGLFLLTSEIHAQQAEQWLRHASTYDAYGRENGNDPEFMRKAIVYCERAIADPKVTPAQKTKAEKLKSRIEITLSTCENNLNHKIEFYQFFLGRPPSFTSNNDPDEHSLGLACGKILGYAYPGAGALPIQDLNIHSLVLNGNCSDELAEIVYQNVVAGSKNVLIPKQQVYEIIGASTDTLYSGKTDTAYLKAICKKYGIEKLGVYTINRIDSVDNIRYVSISFQIYNTATGMGSMDYVEAFGTDKRDGHLHLILYLLLSSMVLITVIAVMEELYDRWRSKTWHLVSWKSFYNILWLKIKLVSASQFLPTVLSFLVVIMIQPLAPEMSTHYKEFESMLWVVALTLSMSLVPTLINLLIINRLDLDGFHTPRGYQNFANASVYGSYFTLFYFYAVKYDEIAHTQHLILIGATFLVGLILGQSIYLILNKKEKKPLFYSGIMGVVLTAFLLIAINFIILRDFSTKGFLWSTGISVVTTFAFYRTMAVIKKRINTIDELVNKAKAEEIKYTASVIKDGGLSWVGDVLKPENENNKIPVYILSGPSGVGKTAMLNQYLKPLWEKKFSKSLNRVGTDSNWYYSDCNEIQDSNEISFEPFVEAFAGILGIDRMEDRGNVLGMGMESLIKTTAGSVNEAAAELLTHKKRDDMRSISEYCNAIAEELEKRNEPAVFILEDIHWIDVESLNFLKRFLKIIAMNKHFPNVASKLKIIFTIRSGQNQARRGLSENELMELLGEWAHQFDIREERGDTLFDFRDFIVKFGYENDRYRLSDASMNLINDLLNQRDAEGKERNEQHSNAGLTPLYMIKLLTRWIEDGTLTPAVGGLVLTRQITYEDLPNSDEIDKFYHAIFDKIPSTTSMDAIQWVRILESAAIIGHKFDASILASVWGLDLLQLLDFLERMEVMELVQDVPGQDNIYRFHNPRVSSALKTYFGKRNISEEKQIVMEYNKRWLSVQFTTLYPCSYMDVERLNIIARRLYSLRHLDAYKEHFKKVWLILSIRYCLKEEYEKLDMLMYKNHDTGNDYVLRSIQTYREYLESEITHDFIPVPEDNPPANSLNWYILMFNKIVSGEMESEQLKEYLSEFSLSAEPVLLEFLIRLMETNEHFIQSLNTELIAFLNKILALKNNFDSDFIMLVKMLKIKLFANPYCSEDYEDAMLISDLNQLQKEFTENTSMFIRYEFHNLKIDILGNMDESLGQVKAFSEALSDLKIGDKINRNWVNYVLHKTNEYIFNDAEIDFEKIFEEIVYFLRMRGYMEDVNELHVTYREADFRMKRSDRYANNLDKYQIDQIENELHSFVDVIESDKHLSKRLRLTYKSRILFRIQQARALYFFKHNETIEAKEYEKSLQISDQLIALYKELNNMASLEVILASKAKLLRKLKRYEEAVEVHLKTLELVALIKNLEPYKKGLAHYHYALTLKAQGNLESAAGQLRKSMPYWSDNAKGKIRQRITEMQIMECVLKGNLVPSDFFDVPLTAIYAGLEALVDNPLLPNLYKPEMLVKKLAELKDQL